MKLIFSEQAWEDYLHWKKTDKTLLRRIIALIQDTRRSPFEGIGKPEPLKHALSGYWSRRINDEHRMEAFVAALDGPTRPRPRLTRLSSRTILTLVLPLHCQEAVDQA